VSGVTQGRQPLSAGAQPCPPSLSPRPVKVNIKTLLGFVEEQRVISVLENPALKGTQGNVLQAGGGRRNLEAHAQYVNRQGGE